MAISVKTVDCSVRKGKSSVLRLASKTMLLPRSLWSMKVAIAGMCFAAVLLVWSRSLSGRTRTNLASEKIQFHELHILFDSSIELRLWRPGEPRESLVGLIGKSIRDGWDFTVLTRTDEELRIEFGSSLRFTVEHNTSRETNEPSCYRILWECSDGTYRKLQDVFHLSSANWFGGSAVMSPLWPVERQKRPLEAFITGDSYNDFYGGVQERFWLSSQGVALFVEYDVPLFVGVNEQGDNLLNFVSSFSAPYGNSRRRNLTLSYSICQAENITSMYLGAAGRFWKKPIDTPDALAFRYPIWSTWAGYKNSINQTKILDFAAEINSRGFKNSHLQIDDGWAEHYGDFNFDPKKFPDPAAMVRTLKEQLGFRVTLWVHPFASLRSNAIHLKDSKGNRIWMTLRLIDLPACVIWWNGIGAVLDLTNPEASSWFLNELRKLRENFKVDSFKFDAGESTWISSWGKSIRPMDNPNDYTQLFVNVAYESDPNIRVQEIRASVSFQHLPMFIRLMDKDSHWGYDNGLRSIIPHVLLLGIIGYPFLLPDMIGGNAYSFLSIQSTTWPERELYIRWMEVTALLPAIQFSVVPWQYDDEVVRIAHKMCALHEKFTEKISALAKEAVRSGAPIIRPVWWIAPSDVEALTVDTEFLLGDDLLVAPVLDQGATDRDVYLPAGSWKDARTGEVLAGKRWHRRHEVPLDELAYFTLL